MTNGCFDLLHVGHIRLFSASKQLGDVMIVAIDDDDSVKLLKGAGRPVIGATERVRILSALDSVDYVVVFATNEYARLVAVEPKAGAAYTWEDDEYLAEVSSPVTWWRSTISGDMSGK